MNPRDTGGLPYNVNDLRKIVQMLGGHKTTAELAELMELTVAEIELLRSGKPVMLITDRAGRHIRPV